MQSTGAIAGWCPGSLRITSCRLCHTVALAGAVSAVAHRVRGGDDFAAMFGGVVEADKVDHWDVP